MKVTLKVAGAFMLGILILAAVVCGFYHRGYADAKQKARAEAIDRTITCRFTHSLFMPLYEGSPGPLDQDCDALLQVVEAI